MEKNKKYTIDYIRNNGLILLDAISGSNAYGTNIEGSDIDYRGVFIIEQDDLYGMNYVDQISDDTNDTTYYELGRFFELALKNNSNILELFNVPDDCIVYKHPIFNFINFDAFLSKKCQFTFGEYASEQIKKARGLNKKIVNPMSNIRKSPLNFCYVIGNHNLKSKTFKEILKDVYYGAQRFLKLRPSRIIGAGYQSLELEKWLNKHGMYQRLCGLINVPNAQGVYALFYDWNLHKKFKEFGPSIRFEGGVGYMGIVKETENGEMISNDIRLSSIPKGEKPICVISYNKDGYTKYCKDFKEYNEWVAKRNPIRYNTNIKHGKMYDGKNLSHCVRLLQTSIEIAKTGIVNVRRNNRDFLLSIRNGEMEYDELISLAESLKKEAEEAYATSTLQKEPDREAANALLVELRHRFYNEYSRPIQNIKKLVIPQSGFPSCVNSTKEEIDLFYKTFNIPGLDSSSTNPSSNYNELCESLVNDEEIVNIVPDDFIPSSDFDDKYELLFSDADYEAYLKEWSDYEADRLIGDNIEFLDSSSNLLDYLTSLKIEELSQKDIDNDIELKICSCYGDRFFHMIKISEVVAWMNDCELIINKDYYIIK